jgi:hypothetical protein
MCDLFRGLLIFIKIVALKAIYVILFHHFGKKTNSGHTCVCGGLGAKK